MLWHIEMRHTNQCARVALSYTLCLALTFRRRDFLSVNPFQLYSALPLGYLNGIVRDYLTLRFLSPILPASNNFLICDNRVAKPIVTEYVPIASALLRC